MKRLAIIHTHPIQYNSPLFKLLHERGKIEIKVFYTWEESQQGIKYDPGFKKEINWDIPLLEGYDYCFVKNVSSDPGSHHFKGVVNPSLIDDIEIWNADAILVFGWRFLSHLKCIRYFSKKKTVLFRGDSNLLDDKNFIKRILRKYFLKWVYSFVDFAMYVGTNNKAYYMEYGMQENQLLFAPHAVDNNRFGFDEVKLKSEALEQRALMGIPIDSIVFLFAGKLERKKDPELLIKAFLQLDNTAHLVLVGNGELEKDLKEKYDAENIHFIDFKNQTEMPLMYRLGNVFVLPSSGPGETWGLAVNEAMASSSAIIVSDKCGCAIDLVKQEKNGYIFKSGELTELYMALDSMKDKKRIEEMGAYSKAIIHNWSFEAICTQIENTVIKN